MGREGEDIVATNTTDGLSLRMPKGEAGAKLSFKALQTYEDGDVVRWIGPEDADEPAPVVTLTAGSAGGGHGAPAAGGDTPSASAAPAASPDDGGGSNTLAIVGVVLGALALVAAIAALVTRRKEATA